MGDERRNYVVARIQEALRNDQRVAELELVAEVTGETVVVSGVVQTREQHDAVTDVLRELMPAARIANETEVGTFPERDEVERL